MPKGVFRRCRPDCTPSCQDHPWRWSAEVAPDPVTGHRTWLSGSGFPTPEQAATARSAIAQHETRRGSSAPVLVDQLVAEWLAHQLAAQRVTPFTAAACLRTLRRDGKPGTPHNPLAARYGRSGGTGRGRG